MRTVTEPAAPTTTTAQPWRWWNLAGLTALGAYSTALGWQAQLVSYPLYRAVPAEDFGAYHAQYSAGIPIVVIAPGFAFFLAGTAFWWTRPPGVPRPVAGVVASTSAVALLSTVLWAIPAHDRLDTAGLTDATVATLLDANLVRSIAITAGTAALLWCVGRRLAR